MSKTVYAIYLLFVLLFAGCAAKAPLPKSEVGEGMKIKAEPGFNAEGLVDGELIWVIQQGLKADAGLFSGDTGIPIKSLDVNIEIVEFLASVNVSVSYENVEPNQTLDFRYPSHNGMILNHFLIKVGDRKFRTVIVDDVSAPKVFKLAREQGFSTVLVNKENFSKMLVQISLSKKANIEADFAYTQLTSEDEGQRVFALPAFKGLVKSDCSLSVSGDFSSTLTSFSGIDKNISGQQFKAQVSDRTLLQKELVIKYKTGGFGGLTMDGKAGLVWDEKSKDYLAVSLGDGVKSHRCKSEILRPVYTYLHYRNMVQQGKSVKEAKEYAIKSKLLTSVTRLLLVDSTK